jgi:hypothetical protein
MFLVVYVSFCLTIVSGSMVEEEVATTYIFGEHDESFLETLSLVSDESPGFIELSFLESSGQLSIDAVRRPSLFPANFKFCSNLLPAAIADFVTKKLEISLDKISTVYTYNAAVDSLVACKCYAGVMVKMGFDMINGHRVIDVSEFCEVNGNPELIGRISNNSQQPHLPATEFVSEILISLAAAYTRPRFPNGIFYLI